MFWNNRLKNDIEMLLIHNRLLKFEIEVLRLALLRLKNSGSSQFSSEELRDLILLCHPDKHNNSDKATKITAKLIKLRQECK